MRPPTFKRPIIYGNRSALDMNSIDDS